MSLIESVADEFEPHVQQRGLNYFESGAVEIVSSNDKGVIAQVEGSEVYDVRIEWHDDLVDWRCSCPYFADHDQCKHIWATMLEAEHQGLFPEWGPDDPIPMRIQRAIEQFKDRVFPRQGTPRRAEPETTKAPPWKRHVERLRQALNHRPHGDGSKPWPSTKRLAYVIDIQASAFQQHALVVEVAAQTMDRVGIWSLPKQSRLTYSQIESLPEAKDRLIIQMLVGASSEQRYFQGSQYDSPIPARFRLHARDYELILKPICETGRCFIAADPESLSMLQLSWDDGPPWELWVELKADESGERYSLETSLRRDDQRMNGLEPQLVLADGLVIARNTIARLEHFGTFPILRYLRHDGPVTLAVQQGDELLSELLAMAPLPRLELPPELKVQQISPPMRPRLKVMPAPKRGDDSDKLVGALSFDYAGQLIGERDNHNSPFDAKTRTIIRRDAVAERAAADKLDQLGFRFVMGWGVDSALEQRRLPPSKLNKLVLQLCGEGWHVEAEGRLYRQPGEFKINVSSGIDWFELDGDIDFGGTSASLPTLLAALRKGEKTIQLGDGTVGILPDQWLSRYGLLARVGDHDAEEGKVRFNLRQVGLLDALLSAVPEATCDATFESARQELRRFDGIAPIDPPASFIGTLRPYQRDGLGWLQFLNRFGFGGCLADDMGLGKTIQVLALLQARRQTGKPSLVVVPKSLVFNWVEEAKRFTPDVRILDHTGIARARSAERFKEFDAILTTYGTMRLDAPFLREFAFDYVILDEAQAIKNASSESAKAARLMRADHRLVLSGTPVQNHLGELWSLFEFLNPGMLGGASVFKVSGAGSTNQIDKEGRELLSRALRPFILRRTKEQVAPDLPEKTEQTIWCDLEPEQRKLYDELREHYRTSLLGQVASEGINKSKIQVLEALLRLRQAACHPGLIDKNRTGESSAKLESLIAQVSEVLEEGHKILVFSQFTSMLAIVKQHLDKQKITYEYLDGKTRDRQQRVERFQNDPDCKLFLISLKAGGLGLNLTAAEYVFLLDPWWNPAIESQAIDRAHRIGQTRHVFAYRIIARDTVEQKVLELQARKKDLADMIINADNSLIGKLNREDLEMLLA